MKLQDAVMPVFVYIYFNLLLLLGGIFAVNLILAVINESFMNENRGRVIMVKVEQKFDSPQIT
jgi:hypothetical protein